MKKTRKGVSCDLCLALHVTRRFHSTPSESYRSDNQSPFRLKYFGT